MTKQKVKDHKTKSHVLFYDLVVYRHISRSVVLLKRALTNAFNVHFQECLAHLLQTAKTFLDRLFNYK